MPETTLVRVDPGERPSLGEDAPSPLMDLLQRTRSCRRFDEAKGISSKALQAILAVTRYCPSGHNYQCLRFLVVTAKKDRLFLQNNMGWAGGIDWDGPTDGQRPAAYVVIVQDRTARKTDTVDHAMVAHAMLMRATELGLGGCMFASMKKDAIHEYFQLPETLAVKLVVAFGVPNEVVILDEATPGQNLLYWRDACDAHHVPKVSVESTLLSYESR